MEMRVWWTISDDDDVAHVLAVCERGDDFGPELSSWRNDPMSVAY